MADVFISHVEEDAAVAIEIAEALEVEGFSTWYYEKHSIPGMEYLEQVGGALDACSVVVLIISPGALGSHQVHSEVVHAFEERKRFIPVLRDVTHPEFQRRQPVWRQALGATTSISMTDEGVPALLPRIVEGLRAMEIASGEPDADEAPTEAPMPPAPEASDALESGSPEAETPPNKKRSTVLVAAVAVVLVAAALVATDLLKQRSIEDLRARIAAALNEEDWAAADSGIAEWSRVSDDTAAAAPWRQQLAAGREQAYQALDFRLLHVVGDTVTRNSRGDFGMALTPDGDHVVTHESGKFAIRDVADGAVVRSFPGLPTPLYGLAISPDGQLLAGTGQAATPRIWRLSDGKVVASLYGHGELAHHLMFSADGERLVTVGVDSTIRVWSVRTGAQLHVLRSTRERVLTAAISPDGEYVVGGGDDSTVTVWRLATGEVAQSWKDSGVLGSMLFSRDGTQLVTSSYEDESPRGDSWISTIKVWSFPDGRMLRERRQDRLSDANVIALTQDGKHLAVSCIDTVKLLRYDDLTTERLFFGHRYPAFYVATTPDRKFVLSRDLFGALLAWRLADGMVAWSSTPDPLTTAHHTDRINGVAVTPDGRHLVSSSNDGSVRIWRLPECTLVRTIVGGDRYQNLTVTADGKHIAAGSGTWGGGKDDVIQVWRLSDGGHERTLSAHRGAVWDVAATPDGRHLVSAGQDSTIRIWRLSDGALIRTLLGHSWDINAVAVTPDGERIVSGSRDSTIRVWDLSDGRLLSTVKAHDGSVARVGVASDQQFIVSTGRDGSIKLWGPEGRRELRATSGHEGWIGGLALPADGRRFVTGGSDGKLKAWRIGEYWDTAQLDITATLQEEGRIVNCVAATPDGKYIISGSEDGTIRVWGVP